MATNYLSEKSVKTKPRLPLEGNFDLTYRCNNTCRHCYINLPANDKAAQARELSLAEIASIADQVVELGAMWCLLTGGEPLLRDDFADVYMLLKRKGLLVSVFTNATVVRAKYIALFTKYPPRDIEITVYGATRASYERVTRRPGSYAAFVRGLDALFEAGVRVRLKAMALRSNLDDMEAIAAFGRARTKDYYRFDPVLHMRYDGNQQRNAEIKQERLTPAEIVALERADEQRFGALEKDSERLINEEFTHTGCDHLFHCGAGNGSFNVGYDGTFRVCSSLWALGTTVNLRKTSLREAWETLIPRVRDLRSHNAEYLNTCRKCAVVNLCLHCAAHAHLETGAMDGATPYFCAVAHACAAAIQGNDAGRRNRMTESNPDAERLIALLSGHAVAAETFDETDWQRILVLAQKQRVAPLLYARLKERGITPTPAAVQRLREIYLASVARNTRLLHEVGNILRTLQAAGIPVIPLKGACLAEAVYGNLALRQIGDVDLLVKPADLAKALAVLRTLGYVAAHPFEIESVRQESQHMPQLSKRGGVTIELHWTIVTPRLNVHFDDNDLDQVWSRATPVRISGVQVLMLSPMDLLWHLCLHASVQHRFDGIGLRGFWDMALVIRRYGDEIDWEQFTRRVHQWGMANGVNLALQLAEEWTGVVIPAPVMHSLLPATPDDATIGWVKHKILNETSPVVQSRFVNIAGKERIADKLAVLRDRLFPSRKEMASMYHAPANSWRILCYYPVRFKYLWKYYSLAMWQVLWRDKTLITEARQEARLRQYLGRD